ncbi:hypothetical protein EWI30_10020 [Enterobacter cloacae]|nr:hypothetical protein EWI30_10020 [Enterobacter cloacae]
MANNVKKCIPTYLCCALMLTCLSSYEVLALQVLVRQDFSVQVKDHTVALGDRWTHDVARKIEVPVEGNFVGEVPFDGTNYKFYQHQRAGLEIFSSNLWWDKAERRVDDYIVSQITLTVADIKTPRGIHVGSTTTELNKTYGDGLVENDSGERWVSYESGNKLLSFEIKDSKIAKITMNYDNGTSE